MGIPKNSLIQVSDTVRIECGPPVKEAVATEELLSDRVTAGHYKVGRKDARGRIIKIGETMAYNDWKSEPVWKVYQWAEKINPVTGEVERDRKTAETIFHYKIVSEKSTKEKALEKAKKLAGVD